MKKVRCRLYNHKEMTIMLETKIVFEMTEEAMRMCPSKTILWNFVDQETELHQKDNNPKGKLNKHHSTDV